MADPSELMEIGLFSPANYMDHVHNNHGAKRRQKSQNNVHNNFDNLQNLWSLLRWSDKWNDWL